MFKTSKSIIIPQLDLSFGLFIIMISITKGQQHGITYLVVLHDFISYGLRKRCVYSFISSFDARSDFDLGYMKACKGFGLFMTTWVVVGVACCILFLLHGFSYVCLNCGRSHRTFLVNVFFVPLSSLYGMVRRANIYSRF